MRAREIVMAMLVWRACKGVALRVCTSLFGRTMAELLLWAAVVAGGSAALRASRSDRTIAV